MQTRGLQSARGSDRQRAQRTRRHGRDLQARDRAAFVPRAIQTREDYLHRESHRTDQDQKIPAHQRLTRSDRHRQQVQTGESRGHSGPDRRTDAPPPENHQQNRNHGDA